MVYRRGFGGVEPPKFQRPSKIVPNSTRLWKMLKIAEFRTPIPQDVRKKKGSKILKLPPVRNCFTSAMTNKLVVIINILSVPKIKKILLCETSCTKLQLPPEPLTKWLSPPDPRSLCPLSSAEFVDHPPPQKKKNSWARHCLQISCSHKSCSYICRCSTSKCFVCNLAGQTV